ncbi:MAG: tetratricopeptide repeat protein [Myxococcota bacterium]
MCRAAPALVVSLLVACAATPPAPRPAPSGDHLIAVPVDAAQLAPAGVTHVMQGLYFLENGYSGAAIAHFRLALLYDADSGYLHQKLAEAWVSEGRLDRARDVLEHGLARAPTDPYLTTMAGELARRNKRYGEAVALLMHGLADEHTVLVAGSGLADALAWQRKTAEAEGRVIDLMNAYPGRDDLAAQLGGVLEDHGRLGTALATYQRAREQKPGSRDAAFGEMRVLDLMGRPADAAASLAKLFAYEPDDVGLYVQVARLYERAGSSSAKAYRVEALRIAGTDLIARGVVASGDIAEGNLAAGLTLVSEMRKTATADGLGPSPAQLSAFIAEAYRESGDPKQCLAELEHVGDTLDVVRTRAGCLGESGRIDEALALLQRALSAGASRREMALDASRVLALEPDEMVARRKLALFLKAPGLGNHEQGLATATLAQHFGHEAEAMALIGALHAVDKSSADLRMRYSDALARNGRLDEAVTILRAMVEEQPEDATRLNALGFTLADAGRDLEEAEVHLRHAYRLGSEESFIVDSLGWLAFRKQSYELAERLLVRAMRGSTNDPEILLHLGETYRARGKREEAHACFVKALAAHPSRPLKARLEQLVQGTRVSS